MTLTIDDLLKRSEQAIEAVNIMRKQWQDAKKEDATIYDTATELALGNQFNSVLSVYLQESLACSQLAQVRILHTVSSLGNTEDTIRVYDSYAWEKDNLR